LFTLFYDDKYTAYDAFEYNKSNLASNLSKQNSLTRRISRSEGLYTSKVYQLHRRDMIVAYKRENIKGTVS